MEWRLMVTDSMRIPWELWDLLDLPYVLVEENKFLHGGGLRFVIFERDWEYPSLDTLRFLGFRDGTLLEFGGKTRREELFTPDPPLLLTGDTRRYETRIAFHPDPTKPSITIV